MLLDRARLVFQIVKLSMVNSSAPVQTRFITLDALRGVAALMVVFYHAGRMFNAWPPRFGYLAVDLFFILSGFVLLLGYRTVQHWSVWSCSLALFDLFTVMLVINEWRQPQTQR